VPALRFLALIELLVVGVDFLALQVVLLVLLLYLLAFLTYMRSTFKIEALLSLSSAEHLECPSAESSQRMLGVVLSIGNNTLYE
jgi:hypothetical protein